MSPEDSVGPDRGPGGAAPRSTSPSGREPVVGSDGASAPPPDLTALPAPGDSPSWPWDGEALPVFPAGAAVPPQRSGEPVDEAPAVDAPRGAPTYRPGADGEVTGPIPVQPAGPDAAGPDTGATAVVRPYVLTRGRTRAQLDLSLETLVSTLDKVVPYQLPFDEAAVLDLCREQTRSVAEVAALRRVPIGVAKVLVADLAAAGLLAVHRTFAATGPDVALMERVLGGLRRL